MRNSMRKTALARRAEYSEPRHVGSTVCIAMITSGAHDRTFVYGQRAFATDRLPEAVDWPSKAPRIFRLQPDLWCGARYSARCGRRDASA